MREHWISDFDMDTLFDITNKQYSDTICFASKPNNHLHAFTGFHLEKWARGGKMILMK